MLYAVFLFCFQSDAQAVEQRTKGTSTPIALSLDDADSRAASVFVAMDSWIYPAFSRLQALGYADSAFAGLRPWTRKTCLHILIQTRTAVTNAHDTPANREALLLFNALGKEFSGDGGSFSFRRYETSAAIDRLYTRQQFMSGRPVDNSYHLGQTLVNDDGRPYSGGYNEYTGVQVNGRFSRFALDVRGEWQRAPSIPRLPLPAVDLIAMVDDDPPQPDSPSTVVRGLRLLDANLSLPIAGQTLSIGKSEDWWGPGQGSAMAWSTNAEPIYAFRINRTEPLAIPLLSRFLGPFRYEALFGELRQEYPRDPWVHAEKIQFKPTPNLELGFSRVVVFAGRGLEPLTFGTFWRSFSSFQNVSVADKASRNDPGARHSSFDFSYRLPFARDRVTLYTDSIVHDDVSPVDAPRHAAVNPGLYISHLPLLPKFDLRVEADDTATSVGPRNASGHYYYWEVVYHQVYTNKGNLFGSWIGRESKGGQAWLTWWLNPRSNVVLGYRNAKAARDFIPGGTTQNDLNLETVWRLKDRLEWKAVGQYERWNIPILKPGAQDQFSVSSQLTWYPQLSVHR